jgi:hypothetical protein
MSRIAAIPVFVFVSCWTAEASDETSQAGHFEFTTHALSASGAACAQNPNAHEYLMDSLVRAFTHAWASKGHAVQSRAFKVELAFVLDRKAELVHLELESEHPVGAGQDTLLAIDHSLRGDPSQ